MKIFRHNKTIKLNWYKRKHSGGYNFGDELSKEIVEKLSGKKVIWANEDNCQIAAMGSIVLPVLRRQNKNKVVIWGSGLMFDDKEAIIYDKTINKIQLVRGKLTAEILGLKQDIFGDPGLLVDHLYKPSKNLNKIGIVPHYVDKNVSLIKKLSEKKDIKIIDVLSKPSEVVSEIASCQLIISSSLHGLIAAHSFGIPAYWVELSESVAGNGFKFFDHYSIFNLKPSKISKEELSNIVKQSDNLIENYNYPKEVEVIKKNIINTFPVDL